MELFSLKIYILKKTCFRREHYRDGHITRLILISQFMYEGQSLNRFHISLMTRIEFEFTSSHWDTVISQWFGSVESNCTVRSSITNQGWIFLGLLCTHWTFQLNEKNLTPSRRDHNDFHIICISGSDHNNNNNNQLYFSSVALTSIKY